MFPSVDTSALRLNTFKGFQRGTEEQPHATRKVRKQLNNFAFNSQKAILDAGPRLIAREPKLEVHTLQQFIDSAKTPVVELHTVEVSGLQPTGRKRRAYELDAVLSDALKEAF
jgi:hypothetical protein